MSVVEAWPTPPLSRRIALAATMFLVSAVFGFLQPFVPLYLRASGMSLTEVGLVSCAGAALALLGQPLLGRLSDRWDSRRPLMVVAAISAGLAYLGYRGAEGALAFTALTCIGVNGTLYLNAVGGVLVGRMVGAARGGRAYAGYRVWGSVGYIVVALLAGALLAERGGDRLGRADLDPVFTYGPLLFFVIAAVSLFVPDRRSEAPPPSAPDAGGRAALPEALRWFLAAYFLYQFGLYGASAYLGIFMKDLGAGPMWITKMFAAGVVCEVLVMTQVGRFADTYGRRPVLALAFVLMPLRLLCYIPAQSPGWVVAVQTLHGLNFGIVGALAVVLVNDLAGERERGVAQARLFSVAGLAAALGPALCGWIAERWGIGAMFAAMSAVGAAGAALFLARVPESLPGARALPGWRALMGRHSR
ncbi:MAG TPA: MFS transporter [Chthonomonadales bacterium]|nr:MFS transporter [Chthonomonadales bacterium]